MPTRLILLSMAFALLIGSAISALILGADSSRAAPAPAGGTLREFALVAEPVRWDIQPLISWMGTASIDRRRRPLATR